MLKTLQWRLGLTHKRAGFKLTEKNKADYKPLDLNAAGLLKCSHVQDWSAQPLVEPLISSIRLECRLFSDEIITMRDDAGVGIEGMLEMVNELYAAVHSRVETMR